ncbi:MAG: glycoside hydrolase family 127 protein [Armatimonadota bacterium]
MSGHHRKVHPTPEGATRWTGGFWGERFERCHAQMIPSMREAMEQGGNGARLANFRIAAGLEEGEHEGNNWSDGDVYKWLEAMAHVYAVTEDAELEGQMDELVDLFARSQDDDGYLCTQVQLNPEKERWGDRGYHELYNMGHLMTAASVHHEATGKRAFLEVAVKLAEYLYATFQPRPVELAHFGWNPSNIMGLVDLYHAAREERYLELAGIFVDMRGSQPGGSDQNQFRVPLREETEAVGHAVTAGYLWCGAADVYAETGEAALWEALDRIWRDVVERRMYITGAIGALHRGTSKRGDLVWEAFGLDYQLPSATAYTETCANISNAMWNRRMLGLTGEAKYADVMETVLYNSMLSGTNLEGTRFCYTNVLRWYGEEHELHSNDMKERSFTAHCYCCPPNVVRTIASLHNWAYGLSDDGVWVHLYGESRLDTELPSGGRIVLRQETEYPWAGDVRLTVEEAPGEALALRVRIPGWAEGASIEVNGERAEAEPGTYATLRRRWSAGDVVALHLPLTVRLMTAHHKVEEARNQLAVMRGPLVYCVEECDLPEGVGVEDVHLPRDVEITPVHVSELLGGVTVLEGEGRKAVDDEQGDALYRSAAKMALEPVAIRMIPYYAWWNRGNHPMSVWLPRA